MIMHRTKRTIYVVLLCVALLAAGFSIYNQFASDNNASQLADQVNKACTDNKILAERQGLNCIQAREVQNSGPAIIKGDKGDQGERGYTGDTGPQGFEGVQGQRGNPGPDGAEGDVGPKGDQGDKGEPGNVGPKGDTGPEGQKGADGKDGVDGKPPASYTVREPLSGTILTCTRNNTNDNAPTYECI